MSGEPFELKDVLAEPPGHVPEDLRPAVLARLIATRLQIQELVKDHNTLKLIEEEIFTLKPVAAFVPKYDQPRITVEVSKDLNFTVICNFYRSDSDEARKFREEDEREGARLQAKIARLKAETQKPIKAGGPVEAT
jgi:hypothetical protein